MKKPQIPQPEPNFLVLESEPIPEQKPARPKTEWRLGQERNERWRYLETRRLGGLVPVHHGDQWWMCASCHKIYNEQEAARACCHAATNQVQICCTCWAKRGLLLRIGECRCRA